MQAVIDGTDQRTAEFFAGLYQLGAYEDDGQWFTDEGDQILPPEEDFDGWFEALRTGGYGVVIRGQANDDVVVVVRKKDRYFRGQAETMEAAFCIAVFDVINAKTQKK